MTLHDYIISELFKVHCLKHRQQLNAAEVYHVTPFYFIFDILTILLAFTELLILNASAGVTMV